MTPAGLLLAFVTIERLAELALARRNTAALIARGGVEVSPGHYPFIVALHAAWLAGLWLIGPNRPVHAGWFAVFTGLLFLRGWVLFTLGRRWTTRIIVISGERLINTGPYRFTAHPNYLVVVGEIAVLPLCLGLPWYALVFSFANAAVLAVRIRAEDKALAAFRNMAGS